MPFGYAAAASAVAGLAGSVLSSNAASSAADKQVSAANRATDMTQANYAQNRADLAPYRDAGAADLATLQTRLPHLSSAFTPDQATLEVTPGYQFALNQGLKGVQNSASARGLGVSGAAEQGAIQFATGLADNTYKTQFDIDQANKTNAFNKLLGMVGAGQSSAAQTGTFGQNATQNAGNFLTSGANAAAAGTVGSANAISGGLNNAGSSLTNNLLLNRLMNSQENKANPGGGTPYKSVADSGGWDR